MNEEIKKENCRKTLYQNTYFIIEVNIFDQKTVLINFSLALGHKMHKKLMDSFASFPSRQLLVQIQQ